MASVGRGSGGFVDPALEELLDSCKQAGRGKASITTFTMCRISSVVKGSFLLRFSAGKDPKDVSLLSRCATEGDVGFASSLRTRDSLASTSAYAAGGIQIHTTEVSQQQHGCTAHALLILN